MNEPLNGVILKPDSSLPKTRREPIEVENELNILFRQVLRTRFFTFQIDPKTKKRFYELRKDPQIPDEEVVKPTRTPEMGLKIHVALDWQDGDYFQIIWAVARICGIRPDAEDFTDMKIYEPLYQAYLERDDTQRYKAITIYPKCLPGEETNVSETLRLVREINLAIAQYPMPEDRIIANEYKAGPGIFVRPGPFSRSARDKGWGTMDYALSFSDQLQHFPDPPRSAYVHQLQEAGWLPTA